MQFCLQDVSHFSKGHSVFCKTLGYLGCFSCECSLMLFQECWQYVTILSSLLSHFQIRYWYLCVISAHTMLCDEPQCSHALTKYGLVIYLLWVWRVFIWTFRHLTDPVRHGPDVKSFQTIFCVFLWFNWHVPIVWRTLEGKTFTKQNVNYWV